MTFFSPTISMDMWSLWPLMMEALADWAIDFFPSMFCCIMPALASHLKNISSFFFLWICLLAVIQHIEKFNYSTTPKSK